MPTVVDELVVRLGLDPSDFNKGQKAAGAAFLKTRDEAKSAGQDVEKSAKGMADSIDRVTKSALALFGVLVGAHGLTDFLVSVTNTDAVIGRLSTNLGISTANLQQWQAAAARMGGSAEGMTSSISAASGQLVNMRTNGVPLPPGALRIFANAGIKPDSSWTTEQYLTKLAQAVYGDRVDSAQTKATLLGQSGFTSDFTNLALAHGGAGLQSYLGSMPVVSDDTIKRLQNLQSTWNQLSQTITQFFSTLVADFGPVIGPFLKDFQNFANILVKSEPTLAAIAKDAASIANSLGGWRVAIEAIVALWAGGKVLGILSAVKGLVGLGGGAAAAEGATGGGLLGTILGAIGGTGVAGVLGGAAAIWLGSAGPAGAGEGGVFRKFQSGAAANGYKPGAVYDPATGKWSGGSDAGAGTGGSRSWRNNNPGNIEYGPYAISMGATGSDGRFAIFPSYALGRNAQSQLLFHSKSYAGLTLAQAVAKWAPKSDGNDVGAYVAALAGGAGVSSGTLMSAMTTAQQSAILNAMQAHEGWRAGVTAPTAAASAASMLRWARLSGHSSSVSNASHVTINTLHIHTAATDAAGIAKDLHGALKRAAKVRPANTGMA